MDNSDLKIFMEVHFSNSLALVIHVQYVGIASLVWNDLIYHKMVPYLLPRALEFGVFGFSSLIQDSEMWGDIQKYKHSKIHSIG